MPKLFLEFVETEWPSEPLLVTPMTYSLVGCIPYTCRVYLTHNGRYSGPRVLLCGTHALFGVMWYSIPAALPSTAEDEYQPLTWPDDPYTKTGGTCFPSSLGISASEKPGLAFRTACITPGADSGDGIGSDQHVAETTGRGVRR